MYLARVQKKSEILEIFLRPPTIPTYITGSNVTN